MTVLSKEECAEFIKTRALPFPEYSMNDLLDTIEARDTEIERIRPLKPGDKVEPWSSGRNGLAYDIYLVTDIGDDGYGEPLVQVAYADGTPLEEGQFGSGWYWLKEFDRASEESLRLFESEQ